MIYLDYNSTTPVPPEVFDVMVPYLSADWGNPSSSYVFGAKLKTAIEEARERVAELVGSYAGEIIFTSCGTESNNTAIHAALKARPGRRHVVTSAVEHSSVLSYCAGLEDEGYRVTYLPVDGNGLLNVRELEEHLTEDTAVVTLMWANNETGVLFPVEKIAEVCRARGVLFHCDAVQVVGKISINLRRIPLDYLSFTGHKLNAPKGIGGLYVNRKAPFSPHVRGGHQEKGRRGGTENVPFIVGMGKAAELSQFKMADWVNRVKPLRDALEEGILRKVAATELNGDRDLRLANTTNMSFHGIEAEALLLLLDQEGICASTGSACLADSTEASHVIKAMKPHATRRDTLRFSLSPSNTKHEIAEAIRAVSDAVEALRAL